jgi:hypothetical protein
MHSLTDVAWNSVRNDVMTGLEQARPGPIGGGGIKETARRL